MDEVSVSVFEERQKAANVVPRRRNPRNQTYCSATKKRGVMQVNEAMKKAGWKLVNGEWVSPHCHAPYRKERVAVAHYDESGKKLTDLVEAGLRQEVGSDGHTEDSPTGATKKQVEDAALHAYQRLGLSREEAKQAVALGNGRARFNRG
jgi:hypothetical protein